MKTKKFGSGSKYTKRNVCVDMLEFNYTIRCILIVNPQIKYANLQKMPLPITFIISVLTLENDKLLFMKGTVRLAENTVRGRYYRLKQMCLH